ncbi:MAG: redoxin domain-containing protein [Micromonosporaceae bacterium]|nr:redoxin domain-containing protein [Micromonosporaceae bacterium]
MRIKVIVGVIAVSAALAGCGGAESGQKGAGEAKAPEASITATSDVPESLLFSGKTVDGKEFKGTELAGKAAVLWFWKPNCVHCKRDAKTVRELASEYSGDVTFVGVGGLGKAPAMKTFVKENNVGSFTHMADESGDVWRKFGVKMQRTYVLISSDGTIAFNGGLDAEKELEAKVNDLA